MTDRETLENRLERLSKLIDEAESRLGAHSVKPVLMQQLFELEEERDGLLQKLEALTGQEKEKPS